MKTDAQAAKPVLQEIAAALQPINDWTYDAIHAALAATIEQLGVKNGQVFWPLRIALTGKQSTPASGAEIAFLLGKDETQCRIASAIQLLGVQ
jgi:glutamyl-tRNA synthetase